MRRNTTTYENSHGKGPKGRGLWMFELVYWTGLQKAWEPFEFNGTYTEAVRAAEKEARSRFGVYAQEVTVLP